MTQKPAGKTFIVCEQGASLPADMQHATVHPRPPYATVEDNGFLATIAEWLYNAASDAEPGYAHEPRRLLAAREHRAAVISAITRLEVALKSRLDIPIVTRRRAPSVSQIIRIAGQEELLGQHRPDEVVEWLRIRNEAVHHQAPVKPKTAHQIVDAVEEIVQRIDR